MSGVTAPFGFFDPMGLTPETNEELQLYREAELAHGRVAMVAALGFLVQVLSSTFFSLSPQPSALKPSALNPRQVPQPSAPSPPQESFHPIFADVGGPAIRQLDVILQTPNGLTAGTAMLFAIFFSEIGRARIGWMGLL